MKSLCLACLLVSFPLLAQVFQKQSGATNPKTSESPNFEYHCQPESAGITVSASGQITLPSDQGRRRGFQLRRTDPTSLLNYVECFKLGSSLILSFESENGEEGWTEAGRVGLDTGKEEWRRRLPGINLGVPAHDEHGLYLGSGGKFSKVGLKTGNLLWSVDAPCARFEDTKVDSQTVVFGCQGSPVKLDKENGKKIQ